MRLATVADPAGTTTAAVQVRDGWYALPYADLSVALRDAGWADAAADVVRAAEAGATALTGVAPTLLLPSPTKVICAGLNYSEHILEMGRELPEYPTLFAKFADTLTGPTDDIVVHEADALVDWEAELTAVIGSELSRGTREQAAAAIAGYTVANDVSLRDWQNRTIEFLQGKAFDRTTPVGPILVTADEIDPKAGLEISCSVNGTVMQSGNTSTLVFDSTELVAYISQFTTLRPGDLILTGTPGGVGAGRSPQVFLRDGDLLTTTIEGIGSLENTYRHTPGEK